jgi:hypothetical protein
VPCELTVPQCGCDADQQCTVIVADVLCTHETPGAPGWNELCTDSCAAGQLCMDMGGAALCYRFCDEDADCEAEGGLCALQVLGGSGARVCSVGCDPLGAGTCPESTKCGLVEDPSTTGEWLTLCVPAGGGVAGDPCLADAECSAGHRCVSVGGEDRCTALCLVSAPSCPGSSSCVPFDPPVSVAEDAYGVCL